MRSRGPVVAAVLIGTALSACTSGSAEPGGPASSSAPAEPLELTTNVAEGDEPVGVDTLVRVDAAHGTLDRVTLSSDDDKTDVEGEVSDGAWTAAERLEPGLTYRLAASGTGDDGKPQELTRTFRTPSLTLDEQTYPSVAPLDDETVGVGMPVIVTFDRPVKDRALYEEHMAVTSTPKVEGSWSWFSDNEVHYRPKTYWPAGSDVRVDLDLNSLPAGNGIYGQQDQDISFEVGDKVVSTVDIDRHTLTYQRNGKTIKTLPVSTGDGGHQTRHGIKVIKEKFASVDMDAASTGVDSDDPGYYNMKGVKWALRITNSGEFLHAAPWNAAYFGRANMSHGCTGLSTADAGWLYQNSRRGDVVDYRGGRRGLEDRNGWTDWNVSWDDWTDGSALPSGGSSTTAPGSAT